MMKTPSIILGIDPGLANTGWGVIEVLGTKKRPLAYGCITTKAGENIAFRLKSLHDGMAEVIAKYQPTEVAIESVYFGANVKSALATGEARGAVLVATSNVGLQVGEYSPTQIKHALVGEGRASKEQVQYMVRMLLGFDHAPSPDHAADALACALTHAQMRMSPQALANKGTVVALEK